MTVTDMRNNDIFTVIAKILSCITYVIIVITAAYVLITFVKDNTENGFDPIPAASIVSIADVFLIGNYIESRKWKNKRMRFIIPAVVLVLTIAFFVLVNM